MVISAKERRGVVSAGGGDGARAGDAGFLAIVKSARLRRGAGDAGGGEAGFDASVGFLFFFIVKSVRLRLGITVGGFEAAGFGFGFPIFGRNDGRGEFNDANLSFCSFINSSKAAFFLSCCCTKAFDDTSSDLC